MQKVVFISFFFKREFYFEKLENNTTLVLCAELIHAVNYDSEQKRQQKYSRFKKELEQDQSAAFTSFSTLKLAQLQNKNKL